MLLVESQKSIFALECAASRDGEMVALEWSEAMSVGVPALDADHRCLVRIINLLDDVSDEEATQVVDIVLDTLSVYCRYHFAREEQVMEGCAFPAASFHHAEHERFARWVGRLRERHSLESNSDLARELLDHLTAWLCHHILIQDMAYKPYVGNLGRDSVLPDLPILSLDVARRGELA
jgi:hemerythrin